MKFPYVELRGRLLPIACRSKGYRILCVRRFRRQLKHIPVYLHELEVKFSGKEFTARIGMSKKLGIGFDIIGRKDFFENFKMCFDEKNKTVETTDY